MTKLLSILVLALMACGAPTTETNTTAPPNKKILAARTFKPGPHDTIFTKVNADGTIDSTRLWIDNIRHLSFVQEQALSYGLYLDSVSICTQHIEPRQLFYPLRDSLLKTEWTDSSLTLQLLVKGNTQNDAYYSSVFLDSMGMLNIKFEGMTFTIMNSEPRNYMWCVIYHFRRIDMTEPVDIKGFSLNKGRMWMK